MSNDELSNDELRQYIADTVGSMAAVPRRRVLVAVDVIIRRHDNALARAEAAAAEASRVEKARLYFQQRSDNLTTAITVEQANNRAAWQRAADLKDQLETMQHSVCPHCGATLTGQYLAPF